MQFTIPNSIVRNPFKTNKWLWIFISVFLIIWINTLVNTNDINNWMLENTLTVLLIIFLIVTIRKYQFSDLTYLLICIYLCLHVYGAQYTYAENPFGYWLRDYFHMSRNHYDRIVHFSFGFLMAYPLREFFISWLKFPKLVSWYLPVEITLSVSAFYELIEWSVADIFFTSQGDAYLGTQGDIWDAQKDIFSAIAGALIATTLISVIEKLIIMYNKNNITRELSA
jgi:putative membrane protein